MTKYVLIYQDEILDKRELSEENIQKTLDANHKISDYIEEAEDIFIYLKEAGYSNSELDIEYISIPYEPNKFNNRKYISLYNKYREIIEMSEREDKLSDLLD